MEQATECTACTEEFTDLDPRLHICSCTWATYHLACALTYERKRPSDFCNRCRKPYISLHAYQPIVDQAPAVDDAPVVAAPDPPAQPAQPERRAVHVWTLAALLFILPVVVALGYGNYRARAAELKECQSQATYARSRIDGLVTQKKGLESHVEYIEAEYRKLKDSHAHVLCSCGDAGMVRENLRICQADLVRIKATPCDRGDFDCQLAHARRDHQAVETDLRRQLTSAQRDHQTCEADLGTCRTMNSVLDAGQLDAMEQTYFYMELRCMDHYGDVAPPTYVERAVRCIKSRSVTHITYDQYPYPIVTTDIGRLNPKAEPELHRFLCRFFWPGDRSSYGRYKDQLRRGQVAC